MTVDIKKNAMCCFVDHMSKLISGSTCKITIRYVQCLEFSSFLKPARPLIGQNNLVNNK